MRSPITLYQPPRRPRTDYRIGLSAWTDKPMIEEGEFNSSLYAFPSSETGETWVDRTPSGFAPTAARLRRDRA